MASIVSLARLRASHIPRSERPGWWTELREGWAAFRERTWVWAITLGVSVVLTPLALAAILPTAAVAATAAGGGAGLITFASIYETAIQQTIPEDVLSRVSSYDWLG